MSWRKVKIPHKKKKKTMQPTKIECCELAHKYNVSHIIGIDEVGRGAIAGPIVVAGAVVPATFRCDQIKDSKRYTTHCSRKSGSTLAKEVVDRWIIKEIPAIDTDDPVWAMQRAQLSIAHFFIELYPNSLVVVDGKHTISQYKGKQTAIIAADAKVSVVSAASVIAKFYRDEKMINDFPSEWEFFKHKGYATKRHLELLKQCGPVVGVHRFATKPVIKALVNGVKNEKESIS